MTHTLRPSKVTPDVHDQLLSLARAGFNRYEIGELLCIHPVYAGKLARDAGVPCPKRVRKLDDADVQTIRQMLAEGVTLGHIARLYDCDQSLISRVKAGKR